MLTKTLRITHGRNAKTLSPSHMKQCIMSESRFDFLRELVKNVPDINVNEEQLAADNYPDGGGESSDTSSPSLISVDISIPGSSGSTTISVPSTVAAVSSSMGAGRGQNGSHALHGRGRNGTGTKRQYGGSDGCSSSTSLRNEWKTTKQHSLDALPSSGVRNQNFYTERSGSGDDVPDQRHDSRPAKLSRIDSAPSCIRSNSLNLNLTPTVSGSTDQPIISFDFTKGLLPYATSAAVNSQQQPSTVATEIMPLSIGGINLSVSIPTLGDHPSGQSATDRATDGATTTSSSSLSSSSVSITSSSLTSATTTSTSHSEVRRPSAFRLVGSLAAATSLYNTNSNNNSSSSHHIQPSVINAELTAKPLVKINYNELDFYYSQQTSPYAHEVTKTSRSLHPSSSNYKPLPSSRTRASQNSSANSNESTTSAHESCRLKSLQTSVAPATLLSSSSTLPLPATASVNSHLAVPQSMQPIVSIDLSNHFKGDAPPANPYNQPSVNATSASVPPVLDLDEDYDDI